ncbi:hypothetical protein KKA94_00325, partial [Patescibacteria group bacterium]|nr:hypothetical protein [Patescibacteria group bacterium]
MIKEFFKEKIVKFSWQRIWVVTIVVIVFIGVFFTGLVVYAHSYRDRILPGLYVGSIPVGGMDREEVVSFLEEMNNKLSEQGITISFDTGEETKSI